MKRLIFLGLVFTLACSNKNPISPKLININLPLKCVQSVELKGCKELNGKDVCKQVKVRYEKSCGEVKIEKEK